MTRARPALAALVLALLVAAFLPTAARAAGPRTQQQAGGAARPAERAGQLIVTFDSGAGPAARAAAHRRAGGRLTRRIAAIDAEVVRVADVEAALRGYRALAAVRFAEPDVPARALHDDCTLADGPNPDCLLPGDPGYPRQWGLQNDGSTVQPPGGTGTHDADVDAPYAWRRTTGSPATTIAILDSGIDRDHEDLAAKVVASANMTGSSTLDDLYGHGTAVAGVAAAIPANGVGVAGVGYDASLMSVKVLDDNGFGSCSTVADGIVWTADNGADVGNLSLGVLRCRALERAVDYAWDRGMLLTAAAGNDGNSTRTYPAYYAPVIAVAATDNTDARASFSQYGDWVDLAAPGVEVYTTFANHPTQLGKTRYDYGNGTSMSAPFAAGAAALVWSDTADADGDGRVNDDVRARLEAYADDIPGTGQLWSAGRLNVCNAAAASLSACPLPGAADGANFLLEAAGRKEKGVHVVDLGWSGTAAAEVDVYRDDRKIDTVASSGSYTDTIGARGSATYTYVVCEADTKTCSNEATVSF